MAYSIFLALLALASCKTEEEDNVVVVTTRNWDEVVTNNANVLVEFYAPWCGHCKLLEPEYAKAATALKKSGVDVRLAKVDATVETELKDKFNIRGFPTLKFFKKGKVIEYEGGRDEKAIVSWVEKKTGPTFTVLKSKEEVKSFIHSSDAVTIGFFKDKESQLAQQFIMVTNDLDEAEFGIASPEVSGDLNVKHDKIVVFKKFDDPRADYDGDANFIKIRAFVAKETTQIVVKYDKKNEKKIFSANKINMFLIMSEDSEKFKSYHAAEVGKNLRDGFVFSFVDKKNAVAKGLIEFLDVKESDGPTLRILYQASNNKKYKFNSDEITKGTIEKFVKDFLSGDVKSFLKSEDVPEDWEKNPVKVLVGKNFDKVTSSKDQIVFVEFYAPWCGHCKNLEPIWNELAQRFEDQPDVMIAKMDSTTNEVESFSINSFPTLKLFTKDGKVLDYKGGRTLDELKKFIDENIVTVTKKQEL